MKKTFCVSMCLVSMLIGLVFSASAQTEYSGTVTMWAFPLSGDDAKMYDPIVKAFNAKFPKVKVDVQVLPWSGRYEKMLTAIAGGNPPNLVYLNDFQVPLFASTGNLLSISDSFSPAELANYTKGALKAVTYGGKVYGVPILTNSLGYLYNVDLFKQAGLDPDNPPETFEELESAIRSLTRKDAQGNVIQWGARFDLNRPSPVTSILPFVWASGGQILDDNGKVDINSPESIRALKYVKGLFDKGYIQKSNITGGGLAFSSGKIGIDLQKEPSEVSKVMKENPALNFKVGPILKDREKIGYVTVGAYAIFSKAPNREATIQWAKFLTNKENTQSILKSSGFMSPRSDINAADYMSDPRLIYMAAQSKWATGTGPMNTKYAEILSAVGSNFNSIILGIKTPEKGLDEVAAQIKSILGN